MCKRIFAEQTYEREEIPFYKIGTLGGVADSYITRALFEEYKAKYNYPRKGEVLLTCSGTVGKCLQFNGENAYYQDSNIVWLANPSLNIINDFLYYVLSNINWGKLNSTTITRIYGNDLRRLLIQYPSCHKEQNKISKSISLLDKRIGTQSKIIEEITTLKKILNTKLLQNEQWKKYKVADIAEIGRGRVISIVEINNQTNPQYPVYSSQTSKNGIMGYLDNFDFDGEYITWTTDGANAGTVFYRNGKFNCTNVCGTIRLKSTHNAYFIAQVLKIEARKYVSINLANPKLMNNVMHGIEIGIPNIVLQNKIAALLKIIDAIIDVEGLLLKCLTEIKKHLLQKLFV